MVVFFNPLFGIFSKNDCFLSTSWVNYETTIFKVDFRKFVKDEQIVVNKNGSAEIAYLGNTLESVIQLADMFKKIGTKEQQEQINAALADLVTIGDYWNEA